MICDQISPIFSWPEKKRDIPNYQKYKKKKPTKKNFHSKKI